MRRLALLSINQSRQSKLARAVGFNHIALEVGDIEQALAFYSRILDFKLRGKHKDTAFIDLGDQFLALQKGPSQPAGSGRHFGLVVDDKEAVRRALAAAGVQILPGPFLDFYDPWGNRIQVVDLHDESLVWLLPYREVQKTGISFRPS